MNYIEISNTLKDYLDQVAPEMKGKAQEMILYYSNQYREQKKTYSGKDLAYNYLQFIQRIIDEVNKNEQGISCSKGCAFCCMINVDVTEDEVDLISEYIKENKIEVDKDRLKKQSKKTMETYKELKGKDRHCVFLNDKLECNIYQVRPQACRKYFVKTPKELCAEEEARVAIFVNTHAEVVASGVMARNKNGSMSKLLLEKI